jgi:hypothetical protein
MIGRAVHVVAAEQQSGRTARGGRSHTTNDGFSVDLSSKAWYTACNAISLFLAMKCVYGRQLTMYEVALSHLLISLRGYGIGWFDLG